jgi:UDP-galactopyranose mutase
MNYDYLVVGAGLFGSTFAYLMTQHGKKCCVIDRRDHIGGLCYTDKIDCITVHKYGPHIFHTSNQKILDFINKFTKLNTYYHRVKACYKGKLYSFPVNLQTFYELYGATSPQQVRNISKEQKQEIFDIFYRGYTEKLWGDKLEKISRNVIDRIPIRDTFNDNYYKYGEVQGIPKHGYFNLFENMLYNNNIDMCLCIDYSMGLENKGFRAAKKVVYTGSIDELLNYKYGKLPYRSLCFMTKTLWQRDFQGIAQVNYTDDTNYMRIIEHKYFSFDDHRDRTVITYEYPEQYQEEAGSDPVICYPVDIPINRALYNKYLADIDKSKYIIGGRLGEYKYMNMDETIASAMRAVNKELENENSSH